MKRFIIFVLIFVGLCSCLSDATLCQPYSWFKVDCNNCLCSADGRHYTCSNEICPTVSYNENYDVKIMKDGHRLLVPKNRNVDSSLENVPRYARNPDGFPYINDEIPSSDEGRDIQFNDIDDMNEESEDISVIRK